MNANPLLHPAWFDRARSPGWTGESMTSERVALRALGLLALCAATAAVAWRAPLRALAPAPALALALGFAVLGAARPRRAALAGAGVAAGVGLALAAVAHPAHGGAASWIAAPLLVSSATLLSLLVSALRGRVRGATPGAVVRVAFGGLAASYALSVALDALGAAPILHGRGWIGMGAAALLSSAVALSLVFDLEAIEAEARLGAPAAATAQAAIGLLAGAVWAYLGAPVALALSAWSALRRPLEARPWKGSGWMAAPPEHRVHGGAPL